MGLINDLMGVTIFRMKRKNTRDISSFFTKRTTHLASPQSQETQPNVPPTQQNVPPTQENLPPSQESEQNPPHSTKPSSISIKWTRSSFASSKWTKSLSTT